MDPILGKRNLPAQPNATNNGKKGGKQPYVDFTYHNIYFETYYKVS
jgi:hypothetical protein